MKKKPELTKKEVDARVKLYEVAIENFKKHVKWCKRINKKIK